MYTLNCLLLLFVRSTNFLVHVCIYVLRERSPLSLSCCCVVVVCGGWGVGGVCVARVPVCVSVCLCVSVCVLACPYVLVTGVNNM